MPARIYPQEPPNRARNDPLRSTEVRLYDGFALQLSSEWTVVYGAAWLGPVGPAGQPQDGGGGTVIMRGTENGGRSR